MKNTFKSYFVVWAILLVLFNVITFVFGGVMNPIKFTPSFWIGYVFITLTFAGQLYCAKNAFDAANLQKLFYKLPLISISWTGLILSFVVGGLCMLLAPLYWIGIIACAIVLAFVAISIVKADIAAGAVGAIDDKIKAKTFFIKALTVDAEALIARAQTEEIKAECKKVYEAVRYSDPMSHDALAAAEGQITIKFNELTNAVLNSDLAAVQTATEDVIILVDDRNKKCKLLK